MKARHASLLAMLLILGLAFGAQPQDTVAAAQSDWTGGVNILSVPPDRVCVGDTISLEGAAGVTYMGPDTSLENPVAPLYVTYVKAQAQLGKVTPVEMTQYNDGFYFTITYKAVQPGKETITLTLNNGLAVHHEPFEVQEKCDYDAFLLTVMDFTADLGEEQFHSITHVTGTGTMKRDREGSPFYQGDGTWHLEEKVLSKPPHCVQYYMPPLIMSGPFELDGRLADEGDEVDVILSFLPNMGEATYHGKTICIDENGERGEGWGYAQGGDPSLASKIEATFPVEGGAKTVELEGAGKDIVESVGDLQYEATLTLIPR